MGSEIEEYPLAAAFGGGFLGPNRTARELPIDVSPRRTRPICRGVSANVARSAAEIARCVRTRHRGRLAEHRSQIACPRKQRELADRQRRGALSLIAHFAENHHANRRSAAAFVRTPPSVVPHAAPPLLDSLGASERRQLSATCSGQFQCEVSMSFAASLSHEDGVIFERFFATRIHCRVPIRDHAYAFDSRAILRSRHPLRDFRVFRRADGADPLLARGLAEYE